ncbi:agglutinin-like [Lycium barbarum]|uniref:agglutinin-like n=1 Tax=Lycium barbarum TaxID=112863 RepID=UPI00293E729A|nr:agglutinin-like [Lycium barbarum]
MLASYASVGTEAGGYPFSLVLKDGRAIVGFHGRSGAYLDAIGVYLQHAAPLPQAEQIKPLKQPKVEVINDEFPNLYQEFKLNMKRKTKRQFGHNFMVVLALEMGMTMVLERTQEMICSLFYGFDMQIKIDGENELLIGIEGFYSPVNDNGGLNAIRQIAFYTNKGKHGPYGTEIRTYFSSSTARGKIVGFHGRSGVFLSAIGVHVEYF